MNSADARKLFHFTPQLYNPTTIDHCLVSVCLPDYCATLYGGSDLIAGRPYANKDYLVASPATRHLKAFVGLLVNLPRGLEKLRVSTVWGRVKAGDLIRHDVTYQFLDDDFDFATDQPTRWGSWAGKPWEDRVPNAFHSRPLFQPPRMDVLETRHPRLPNSTASEDDVDAGFVIQRREVFALPTVERQRLFTGTDKLTMRYPPTELAMRI